MPKAGDPCDRPGCAGLLVLRTARKGPNPGQQFLGCSTFPNCRQAHRIDGPAQRSATSAAALAAPRAVAEQVVPRYDATTAREAVAESRVPERRQWIESGIRPGWTVQYLSVGGRLRACDTIPITSPELIAASTHAAMYSTPEYEWTPTHVQAAALAVYRGIVSRGSRPPVDPRVEEEILRKAGLWELTIPAQPGNLGRVPHPDRWRSPSLGAIEASLCWREPFVADSRLRLDAATPLLHPEAEEPFLRHWLPHALGGDAGHWVHPQAGMRHLVRAAGEDYSARRVDFLLAHPLCPPFVVEIDGEQHRFTTNADAARTDELSDQGLTTIRVPASQVRLGSGVALQEIADKWLARSPSVSRGDSSVDWLTWGPTIAQRIMLAISRGLDAGWLRGDAWHLAVNEPLGIAHSAVTSAASLLVATSEIWNAGLAPRVIFLRTQDKQLELRRTERDEFEIVTNSSPMASGQREPDLIISIEPFLGPFHQLPDRDGRPKIVIRSTFLPRKPVDQRLAGGTRRVVGEEHTPPSWALRRVLQSVFAKADFQPAGEEPRAQERAIRRLLAGRDSVVLLPTGAGKSLIYQMAGLLLPGLTLVIDPIVSLIDDQIGGLAEHGIDRAIGITSRDTRGGGADELLHRIRAGEVDFAFVSPERIQNARFRDALHTLTVASTIALAVVDEAHCVSEWGHDFRTSYLDLGRVLREVCADSSGAPPTLLALTGTASRAVLRDMLTELAIERNDPASVLSPENFDRSELNYHVVRSEDETVEARLLGLLQSIPQSFGGPYRNQGLSQFLAPRGGQTNCGIIFCSTIGSPTTGLKHVADFVQRKLSIPLVTYSGKSSTGQEHATHDLSKKSNAQAFKMNEQSIMVATKAYGMGIDKPNVRFIVHVGIPGSIEAYYQEAGRAGRDRRAAHCWILHIPMVRRTHDFFLDRTFRGAEEEAKDLVTLLELLMPVGEARTVEVPWSDDDDKLRREKATHRLKLLGVVRDYTVDWGRKRFTVRTAEVTTHSVDRALLAFVRRNQPGRVMQFARLLEGSAASDVVERVASDGRLMIDYVYETIVAARKRAVDEMELMVKGGGDDSSIRDRILRYLDLGEVARRVEELLDQEPFDFASWLDLYQSIQTLEDARDWRGATSRLLESQPDHPGLLLGRGLAETLLAGGDPTVFVNSTVAALRSAEQKYSAGADSMRSVGDWIFAWVREREATWIPLAYLALERAGGAGSDASMDAAERDFLSTAGLWNETEAAIVFSRRLRRFADLATALDLSYGRMESE